MGKNNEVKLEVLESKLEKYEENLSRLLDDIVALHSLIQDLQPVLSKIGEEATPTISELRERFEKEEVIDLLKKLGDNLPKLSQAIDDLMSVYSLVQDLQPVLSKIGEEATPTISELRERFEKEEVVDLLKKLGDTLPTLSKMLDDLTSVYSLVQDLQPVLSKIGEEATPTISELRERFEKEEVIDLLKKLGDNLSTLSKALDKLIELEKSGTLDALMRMSKLVVALSNKLSDEDIENLAEVTANMAKIAKPELVGIAESVTETITTVEPKKVGTFGLFSAMRDEKVQKGLGLTLELLKALGDAADKIRK